MCVCANVQMAKKVKNKDAANLHICTLKICTSRYGTDNRLLV